MFYYLNDDLKKKKTKKPKSQKRNYPQLATAMII